jgi:hypothetical protein
MFKKAKWAEAWTKSVVFGSINKNNCLSCTFRFLRESYAFGTLYILGRAGFDEGY